MDRGHDDRFDDAFDLWDPSEVDPLLDDAGGDPPPLPPVDPPRGGPPRPPRPEPVDDVVFSGMWTVGALTLMCLFAALQAVMITVGARGGITTVYALVLAFCALYFVPLLGGTWWFWRMQGRSGTDPWRPQPTRPPESPADTPRDEAQRRP